MVSTKILNLDRTMANPRRFIDNAYSNFSFTPGIGFTSSPANITLPSARAPVSSLVSRGEKRAIDLATKVDTELAAAREAILAIESGAFSQTDADALYQPVGSYATSTQLGAVDTRLSTVEGKAGIDFAQSQADALYPAIADFNGLDTIVNGDGAGAPGLVGDLQALDLLINGDPADPQAPAGLDQRVGDLEAVTHFSQIDADALYQPLGDYAAGGDVTDLQTRVGAIEGREAGYASASDLSSLQNQMNTLLDSGTALDAISELKLAWEAGDSTLQGTLNSLTTQHNNEIADILQEIADIKAVLDMQSS